VDKFRPDGTVVLSLGDSTRKGSILLNPVTRCNVSLSNLLSSKHMFGQDKERFPEPAICPATEAV
jgi:hypothetical protein